VFIPERPKEQLPTAESGSFHMHTKRYWYELYWQKYIHCCYSELVLKMHFCLW